MDIQDICIIRVHHVYPCEVLERLKMLNFHVALV